MGKNQFILFSMERTNAEQVLPVYKEFTKKYKKPEDLLKSSGERLFLNLGLHWRDKQIIELAEGLVGKNIPESKDRKLYCIRLSFSAPWNKRCDHR